MGCITSGFPDLACGAVVMPLEVFISCKYFCICYLVESKILSSFLPRVDTFTIRCTKVHLEGAKQHYNLSWKNFLSMENLCKGKEKRN